MVLGICIIIILCITVIGVWSQMDNSWNHSFQEMENSKIGWASYSHGTLLKTLDHTENADFNKLAIYDYEALSQRIARDSLIYASSTAPFITQYQEDYPIQRIEAVDNSHVCVEYKIADDNGDIVYLYVLFEQIVEEQINEHYETVLKETWRVMQEWYYVSKPLTYADFLSIQIGDDYEAFEAIDPAVKYDYLREPRAPICGFISYRLLEDGILIVEFEDTDVTVNEENVYIPSDVKQHRVKSMQFYPWGDENASQTYSILKQSADSIELPSIN